jgi:hypothetical protein
MINMVTECQRTDLELNIALSSVLSFTPFAHSFIFLGEDLSILGADQSILGADLSNF